MDLIKKPVEIILGFFVLGILASALLFPAADSWRGQVFANATGTYLKAPVGSTTGDIVINAGVYTILNNMILFMTLAVGLVVIGVVVSYLKWKS